MEIATRRALMFRRTRYLWHSLYLQNLGGVSVIPTEISPMLSPFPEAIMVERVTLAESHGTHAMSKNFGIVPRPIRNNNADFVRAEIG